MLWEMYAKSRSKIIQKTSNAAKRRSLLLLFQFKNIAVLLRSISTAVYTLEGQLASTVGTPVCPVPPARTQTVAR
jgi:hypothetical protein